MIKFSNNLQVVLFCSLINTLQSGNKSLDSSIHSIRDHMNKVSVRPLSLNLYYTGLN